MPAIRPGKVVRSGETIEMVPEAPRVKAAIRYYDAAFDDMERQFCETAWLGERDFGFADNCMIP